MDSNGIHGNGLRRANKLIKRTKQPQRIGCVRSVLMTLSVIYFIVDLAQFPTRRDRLRRQHLSYHFFPFPLLHFTTITCPFAPIVSSLAYLNYESFELDDNSLLDSSSDQARGPRFESHHLRFFFFLILFNYPKQNADYITSYINTS